MTDIKVRNLRDDLSFGSVIEGVDWETIGDEAVRQRIREVFEDRGVIVFSDVEPSSKMQVALSNIFGPLKVQPS